MTQRPTSKTDGDHFEEARGQARNPARDELRGCVVPDEASVPAEWRALDRWLIWDNTPRPSEGKPCKKPICARNTGRQAKVNDPSTWSRWDVARRTAARLHTAGGVGFVLGEEYFGIDLDHVLVDGGLVPAAREFVESLSITWAEVSPSCTGLHLVFRLKGPLPQDWRKQVKNTFGPGTGLEAYGPTSKRYFTVTGNTWRDAPIADLTEADVALLSKILSNTRQSNSTSSASATSASARHDGRDDRDNNDDLERARWLLLDVGALDGIVDDYEGWLRVLAALRPLGDAGLELAVTWSRRGQKFVEGDVERRWWGLSGSSVASIFGMADDADPTWRARWRNAMPSRERGSSPQAAVPAVDGRPVIVVNLTEFHALFEFALEQLAVCNDVAVQGGRLVEVTRDERTDDVLRVTPLSRGRIRERLSRLVLWQEGVGEKLSMVHPPAPVVVALTEVRAHWPGVRGIATHDPAATAATKAFLARGPIVHVPTRLDELDRMTDGGFVFGSRAFLLGSPDAGKTLLLTQMLDSLAQSGVAVGILCVDEDLEDVIGRLLQRRGVRRGEVERQEGRALQAALRDVEALPLRVYDDATTVEDAASDLAAFSAERGLQAALFVDSVQTVRCDVHTPDASEYERVTACVGAIRLVSKRFRMLVVATSEMNRSGYRSKISGELVNEMAVGKMSGAIEYCAKILLSIKSVAGESDLAELRVVKCKYGRGAHREGEPGIFLRLDRGAQAVRVDADYEPAAERDDRQAEAVSRVEADAALIVELALEEPGVGKRELVDRMQARHGVGKDRVRAAVQFLVDHEAISIEPGPNRAQHHHLVGTNVPESILLRLAAEDRIRVLHSGESPSCGGAAAAPAPHPRSGVRAGPYRGPAAPTAHEEEHDPVRPAAPDDIDDGRPEEPRRRRARKDTSREQGAASAEGSAPRREDDDHE